MGVLLSSPAAVVLLAMVIFFAAPALGGVHFSSLSDALTVKTSAKEGQVLKVGEDKITVTWNQITGAADAAFKKMKLQLCYAPVSQIDRGWRKTQDELKKDKTCQFDITTQSYTKAGSFEYTIERDVPTASYFVRAYLLDSTDTEVAFGQSTDAQKTTNLFKILAINGRSASLDIAAACFSGFSVVSLVFFFVLEKRKGKK